jgi:hypothetical protein
MQFGLILPHYIAWHYARGLRDIIGHIRDFMWFFWNLFSVPELLKTFFAPFERLGQTGPRRFDPEKMLEAFATNLIMRFVGMLVRGFFIVLGLAMLVAVLMASICFLIVWVLLPVIMVAMLIAGVIGLFR